MYRKEAVAGHFYPDNPGTLADFIDKHRSRDGTIKAKAAVVPHAGYLFSGALAVKTLSKAEIPDTVLIIGPNHTGFGEDISLFDKGVWRTPLGDVTVEEKISSKLAGTGFFKPDYLAHAREYSIEVLLPILRHLNPAMKIVPVAVAGMGYPAMEKVAAALAEAVKGEDLLIVVSADLNHHDDAVTGAVKDKKAINCMLELDGKSLYDTVINERITTCGLYSAVIGLSAAKALGAQKGLLIDYTHSGMVTKDHSDVVGYAGIVIK